MMIRKKEITSTNDGERIDTFISNTFDDISRSLAQDLIKNGEILLDGKKVKVSTKVHEGQVVEVPEKMKMMTIYFKAYLKILNKK